ncbi:phosphonate ABC transporter ATP-binding protein [Porphyromonas macacae]|uniref:cell division ATP-binding protein FtsE n=1 Tax=Porphyromonas macacae TaxID=28115 RepID=UPI00052CBBF4|nr:ATP-binding cassette domain-containing protein [Porphyromonas macacae]KGN99659.1 phosphonate ABC transporter ATP-binding protein [Porphyromonas macacae]
MTEKNVVLRFEDVSVSHYENKIFEHLDLTVRAGDFIYIVGPVGSGKSTLLKSVYAETPIEKQGAANVLGFDLLKLKRSSLPRLRRQLGIVFQDFRLLENKTAIENLDFVLRATGVKNKQIRKERITGVLQEVGMELKGYKYPHELSGGEQQRIAIARALLSEPKLILADEPTGNLDVETGLGITRILQKIASKGKTAILMATHNERIIRELPAAELYIGANKPELSVASASQERQDGVSIETNNI